MGVLNRNAILSADDLRQKTVSVPEWGGDVIVREMSAAEEAEFAGLSMKMVEEVTDDQGNKRRRFKDAEQAQLLKVRVVAWCAIDENGKRLFKENDVKALQQKSPAVIGRLADAAVDLSGEDQEALAKNSEPSTSDDLPSG